jgi:hypothetical protein
MRPTGHRTFHRVTSAQIREWQRSPAATGSVPTFEGCDLHLDAMAAQGDLA